MPKPTKNQKEEADNAPRIVFENPECIENEDKPDHLTPEKGLRAMIEYVLNPENEGF